MVGACPGVACGPEAFPPPLRRSTATMRAPMSASRAARKARALDATHFRAVAILARDRRCFRHLRAEGRDRRSPGRDGRPRARVRPGARALVDRDFGGPLELRARWWSSIRATRRSTIRLQADGRRAERALRKDEAVGSVVPPRRGISISRDGRTALIRAGAARGSNDMVRAADDLKGRLSEARRQRYKVNLTGASGMWSDFNQANRTRC